MKSSVICRPRPAIKTSAPVVQKLPKQWPQINATMRERYEGSRVIVEIWSPTFIDCAKGCARYVRAYPEPKYRTAFEVVEEVPANEPKFRFRAWGTRFAVEGWV